MDHDCWLESHFASADRLGPEFAVKPQAQSLGRNLDAEAAQRHRQHLDGLTVAPQSQQFFTVGFKLCRLRLLWVARFCDQLGERGWWWRSDVVVCKW